MALAFDFAGLLVASFGTGGLFFKFAVELFGRSRLEGLARHICSWKSRALASLTMRVTLERAKKSAAIRSEDFWRFGEALAKVNF
jgi:hypothetical protein